MNSPPRMSYSLLKIGGSLLRHPGLADRLRELLAARPEIRPLLIVGGGAAADIVREWHRTQQLSDEQAHQLAIAAMQLNEALLQELLPELRLVRSAAQLDAALRAGVPPLACMSCLIKWGESRGWPPVPRSWDVTSDSLAAWLATGLQATELVLAKSCPAPQPATLATAVERGLVDPYFPVAVAGVQDVLWCDALAHKPEFVPLDCPVPTQRA